MNALPPQVQLEVPRFGEFARQLADVGSRHIDECLAEQRRHGDRLGNLLVRAGHLTPAQVLDILRSQARWAARMRSADLASDRFPLTMPFSLCFPCYNEQEVIEEVLAGALTVLPEFLDEFEIIVVDDGSADRTAEIVRQIANRDGRVRLISHEHNRGYGAAVATALRAAHGEWIFFTDGDGQFNLLDLPQLLVEAQRADVVIGYRYDRADNRLRRLNAAAWKWLIRCLVGLRVRDLDCAFKLFPRWVVERLQLTSDGACISAEIMAQCQRGGLKIAEVPVHHYPRSAGTATGANLRVIAKAFRELPVIWQYRHMKPWRREARPAADAPRTTEPRHAPDRVPLANAHAAAKAE